MQNLRKIRLKQNCNTRGILIPKIDITLFRFNIVSSVTNMNSFTVKSKNTEKWSMKLNASLVCSNFGWEYFLPGYECKQPRWRRGMSKKYCWSCKSKSFASINKNNNDSKCIKVQQHRGIYNKNKKKKNRKNHSETSCVENYRAAGEYLFVTCKGAHPSIHVCMLLRVSLYLCIFVEFQPSQFPNDDSTSLWTLLPTTQRHTHTHTHIHGYWFLLLLLHSHAIFPSISWFASASLLLLLSLPCCLYGGFRFLVYCSVTVARRNVRHASIPLQMYVCICLCSYFY